MAEKKERSEMAMILYDEQYRLKLSLFYFLLDKVSFIAIAVCFAIFRDFGNALTAFVFVSMAAYKYFFNYTKDGDHYKVITYQVLINILPKIREKA